MKTLLSCEFNMDTGCVDLRCSDDSMISINCTAVEDEVANSRFQRSELDWLIYNDAIFNSVIIITDRRILDQQLQATVSSYDHTLGSVVTIDEKKNSGALRDAINDGKRIIVTTLQKFPVIYNGWRSDSPDHHR